MAENEPHRPCCSGGKRHWMFDRHRFAYAAISNRHQGEVDGYFVERIPKMDGDSIPAGVRDYLCVGGHWSKWDARSMHRKFRSARQADQMANRLSAGLPVHRDRWLVLGAIVLLTLEFVQAFRWW